MNRTSYVVVAALVMLPFLSGCRKSEQVVARVNRDVISEKDFQTRVKSVDVISLTFSARRGGAAKAGEFAIQDMITERLILQAAAEKQASPTDAEVDAFLKFVKTYPQYAGEAARNPFWTDADWKRFGRVEVAVRKIALKSTTLAPDDLQKIYTTPQVQAELKGPDRYHLRLITCLTSAKASAALAALKQGVPFETVALQQSDDPTSRQRNGDVGSVPVVALPDGLRQAVEKLKPGEYTPSVVVTKVTPTDASGQRGSSEPRYFLAQLVEKQPAVLPTLDAVRPLIENLALQQKNPNANVYVQQTIRDFTAKADIQVNIPEYRNVVTRLKSSGTTGQPGQGTVAR